MLNENGHEMNNSRRRKITRGIVSVFEAMALNLKVTPGVDHYRDTPRYRHSGSHSCKCGRAISNNKKQCLSCSKHILNTKGLPK